MRQLRAILMDSLYESLDRKALVVVLGLSVILIVFVAGISFETETQEAILERQARSLSMLSRGHGFGLFGPSVECRTSDIGLVGNNEGWHGELAGGRAVTLTFTGRGALDQLVRRWRAFEAYTKERGREPNSPRREPPADESKVTPEDRVAFLEARFARMGYGWTQAQLLTEQPLAYRVAVRTDYPHELTSASRLKMLYGALDVPLWEISVAETVVRMQLLMANLFAGFLGIVVAVMACSGFVPSMLQKGTLDLVLARPIGRGRLLLYKYAGGLWFVFIASSFLIGGSWLAITLRTGYANPWFLATIVTITAVFAVIYSVAVLVGVLTRSGTVSALVALAVWGTSSTMVAIKHNLRLLYRGQPVPEWLQTTLDVLYGMAPKTSDLTSLNDYFLSRSHLSEAAYQRAFAGQIPKVDWLWSLGTTAAFTAAMLALAIWLFRRRDY
jgi:ABC-type transport system involved in multi-copper enzyme maturation permease subunit